MRTVHLYVFDGYVDWEPAFAVAGLRDPAFQREPGAWDVKTVALDRAPLRSMGGLLLQPDLALQELQPTGSALLILPGGPGWEQAGGRHEAAIAKAQDFMAHDVPVAAICGATAGLARAGVLDARRHTSNAIAYLKGTGYGGTDRYEDAGAFDDQGVITAGGMAPVDFAHAIFKRLQVYDDDVLEAWLSLYKTGRSEFYAHMQQAAAQHAAAAH
jgi:putative intracellular protease/amidase